MDFTISKPSSLVHHILFLVVLRMCQGHARQACSHRASSTALPFPFLNLCNSLRCLSQWEREGVRDRSSPFTTGHVSISISCFTDKVSDSFDRFGGLSSYFVSPDGGRTRIPHCPECQPRQGSLPADLGCKMSSVRLGLASVLAEPCRIQDPSGSIIIWYK